MTKLTRHRHAGLTLMELMVTLAILSILATLAAPSFTGYLNRKKVEGEGAELFADLQYARSESVSQNAAVRVNFTETGYTIAAEAGVSAPTSCTPAGTTTPLKAVTLDRGVLTGDNGGSLPNCIIYEPVRGSAPVSASVEVVNSAFAAKLRVATTRGGRAQICSPSGSTIRSYATCS